MPTGTQETLDVLCAACEDTLLTEDTTAAELSSVCSDCYDETVVYCEQCSDSGIADGITWNYRELTRLMDVFQVNSTGTIQSVDGYWLCDNCYFTCSSCDTLYNNLTDAESCCHEEEPEQQLHYYSFHPTIKFWHLLDNGAPGCFVAPKNYVLYMGIELEMEKVSPHAQALTEAHGENWDYPNIFYWKHDGSLGYQGAELVTQPMTLDAFMKKFPFNMLEQAQQLGARSFYYDTCGFHIHVSRTAFTPSHMWKFIKLQTKAWRPLSNFSGRENSTWASWHGDSMDDVGRDTVAYAKYNKRQPHRYSALNFQNHATVELRYFKGNINPDAVKRNVQIVDAMYEFTKQLTFRDVVAGHLSWSSLKAYMSGNDRYYHANEFIQQIGV